MHLDLGLCVVRDWRADDAPSLQRHADDRRIWRNMRDAFPHPYGAADAGRFLARVAAMRPVTYFAIAVEDAAVGGIGYTLQRDVERVSAELGYWLGVGYWGRGITTAAVRAVTAYAFRTHAELNRLYAMPFAWNPASARVLEKAGWRLEARFAEAVIKEGQTIDQLLYAILRRETPGV